MPYADAGPAIRARMIAGFDRYELNSEICGEAPSTAAADVPARDDVACVDTAADMACAIMASAYYPGRGGRSRRVP